MKTFTSTAWQYTNTHCEFKQTQTRGTWWAQPTYIPCLKSSDCHRFMIHHDSFLARVDVQQYEWDWKQVQERFLPLNQPWAWNWVSDTTMATDHRKWWDVFWWINTSRMQYFLSIKAWNTKSIWLNLICFVSIALTTFVTYVEYNWLLRKIMRQHLYMDVIYLNIGVP